MAVSFYFMTYKYTIGKSTNVITSTFKNVNIPVLRKKFAAFVKNPIILSTTHEYENPHAILITHN